MFVFRSQRTRRWTIVAFVLAATVASAIARVVPCASPHATFSEVRRALATGDINALLTARCLGASEATRDAVVREGEREYARVLAIYQKQINLGGAEFDNRVAAVRAILGRAATAGRARFDASGEDEKWRVWVGSTHDTWLYGLVAPRLSPDVSAIVTGYDFLADTSAQAALAETLGCQAIGPDAVTVLGAVRSGAMDGGDRTVARTLARCRSTGIREVRRAVDAVWREMRRDDPGRRRRPPGALAATAEANERAHVESLGREALDGSDTAYLSENERLLSADRTTEALRLGLALLTADERSEIGDVTMAEFVAARGSFVSVQGAGLFREMLTEFAGRCTLAVVESRTAMPTYTLIAQSSWALSSRAERAGGAPLLVTVDGTESEISPSAVVPTDLLIAGVPATVRWDVAVERDLLRPGISVATSCDQPPLSIPDVYVLHAGRWHRGPVPRPRMWPWQLDQGGW